MAVPSTINTFPTNICINKLSTKQIFPKIYYSNRVEAQYLEATITIALTDQTEIETLQKFWYSELVDLYYPFKMTLPLFGTNHEYTVRVIGDLKASWKDGIFPKEETFTIQILDNIEQTFNQNRLDVLIEMDGGEVTFIADNEVHVDWGDGIIKQYEGGSITGVPFDYMRITSLEAVTAITFQGDLIKSIDVVKGMDLTNGDNMCRDLAYMESFTINNAPNLTTTNSMFEGTTNLQYPPASATDALPNIGLYMGGVTTANKMWKGSGIILLDMDTSNVTEFAEFVMNAVELQCISRLNTLSQTTTTDMFTNTPLLVYPDATTQTTILAGADWENDQYCPFFVTRYLQNLLYDNTNIATEFTTLTNADTYTNKLVATDYDAEGISSPLSVEDITKRITQVKAGDEIDFKGTFSFETIDNGDSIADTLQTYLPIVNGDNLVIVLANNSVNEIVASGVSTDGADNLSTTSIVPAMTSNILPSGTAFATNDDATNLAYMAFDGGTTNGYKSVASTTFPVRIGYINTTALSINKYIVTGNGTTVGSSPQDWTLEGSNDTTTGLDGTWDVLDTITGETAWTTNEARTFTLDAPTTEYTSYRLNITTNNGDDQVAIEELKFIQTTYSMDTTSTTAGATPSKTYAVDVEVAFDIGTGFRVPTIASATYTPSGLSLTDPFEDGSLVARYPLAGDATEIVNGAFNDGVASAGVAWFNDPERGMVANLQASLSNIQTDLKTSDLNSTFTIAFWSRRLDYNNYDIPYVEVGSYGAWYIFEGKDANSFDDYNGGMYKDTDGPRVQMQDYRDIFFDWGLYGYSRTNGVSNANFVNGASVRRIDAGFATQPSSTALQIGSDGSFKVDNNFNGYLSDFMFFNRELTDEEWVLLYASDGGNLLGVIHYNTVVDSIGSQDITTRVRLKNVGDAMIELSGELHGVEETSTSTNCWSPLTQLLSGWYGKDSALATTGTITPDKTSDYTNIYAYKFEAVYGEFRASFGADGDWQLPNTNLIVYQHPLHGNVELYWDSVNNDYRGFNLELATAIVASDVGEESCFTSLAIPYNAVEYSFETLDTES